MHNGFAAADRKSTKNTYCFKLAGMQTVTWKVKVKLKENPQAQYTISDTFIL